MLEGDECMHADGVEESGERSAAPARVLASSDSQPEGVHAEAREGHRGAPRPGARHEGISPCLAISIMTVPHIGKYSCHA